MRRSRLRSCFWVACTAILAALTFGSEVEARTGAHDSRSLTSGVCHTGVTVGVLPDWARAGFRDPNPEMPYVLGKAEGIAGSYSATPLARRRGRVATTRSCGSRTSRQHLDRIC